MAYNIQKGFSIYYSLYNKGIYERHGVAATTFLSILLLDQKCKFCPDAIPNLPMMTEISIQVCATASSCDPRRRKRAAESKSTRAFFAGPSMRRFDLRVATTTASICFFSTAFPRLPFPALEVLATEPSTELLSPTSLALSPTWSNFCLLLGETGSVLIVTVLPVLGCGLWVTLLYI